MSIYHFEKWSEKDFFSNKEQWNELLTHSENDPLFSSWEWQFSWWENGFSIGLRLELYAIYQDNILVAIIPLITHQVKFGIIFNLTRCQLIGCSYGINDVNRSDNLDIILRTGVNINDLNECIESLMKSFHWHDFILDGVSTSSHILKFFKAYKSSCNIYTLSKYSNYIIDLKGDFKEFSAQLKKKVRQKTILHRRLLPQNTALVKIKTPELSLFLAQLNTLKKMRWGKPVYQKNRLSFQEAFIKRCGKDSKITFNSSLLEIDSQNESAFYAIETTHKVYFLQYAFNPNFNSKLSLGFLHLGFVIEELFESNIDSLILLPGSGKTTNYKQSLSNNQPALLAVRISPSWWLNVLLKSYSLLKCIRNYFIK